MAIGTLTVGVAANASKGIASLKLFRREVKAVKTDTSAASGSVGGFTSALTRVGASLAGAAAGYLSTRAFLTIAGDLDALGEQSERLGVTAQKLQELRYAGQMTGVATELLDKSVGRLSLNISKAAVGTGAGKDALSELGVTIKDLNAQSPDQQFRTIAEAMGSVASQNDKARIATALFGKEGRTLLPTLNLGAEGLGKMAAESRKLQGVLKDTDIAKVAEMNDAIDRLKAAAGGAGNEIVISAAPSLTVAADAMAEALQGMKSFKMPDNVVTRNVGGVASAAHDSLAGVYYRNFFGGSDDDSAGALTAEEALAGNRRVSKDKYETSTDPTVAFNRMVNKAAKGNELRYGKAFNDNTVGVATKAIGAGAKGFLDLAGQLKTQAAELRKTTLGRSARGLNPLTGLAPIQMSQARQDYIAGRGSKPGSDRLGPVSDRINRLVDAGGMEGYQALRANQRTARLNPADKSAPKIEKHTKDTAEGVKQMADFFAWVKLQKPRSA